MKRLAVLILLLPLLGLWGLGVALHSPRATGYLLRALARHTPGLEIDAVQGALSGPLTLEGLDWSGTGPRVHLDRLALDWRPSALLAGRLRILSLQASGVKLRLPPSERPADGPFELPQIPALRLPLPVDLHRLQVDHLTIQGPTGDTRIGRVRLGLSAQGDRIRLDGLEFDGLGAHLEARGRIWLAPRLPLRLKLRWRFQDLAGEAHLRGNLHHLLLDQRLANPWTGETNLSLQAGLDGDRLHIERLDVLGPGRISARGTWSLQDQTFRLHLEARDQGWPLRGTAEVRVPELRLDLSGRPEGYAFRIRGRATAPTRPPLDIEGHGRGDLESLRIAALRLRTPRSKLQIWGDLAWAPVPRWDLDLESDALDPAEFLADWPGHLQAVVHTQGRWPGEAARQRLQIEVKSLEGRLRGRPLKTSGRVALAGQAWRIEDLRLTSGKARLEASGRLDQTLDLRWAVQAADLADLLPQAAGRIQARGRVWGDPTRPRVQGHIQGRKLAYARQGVDRLDADLDLGLAPKAPTRLQLQASGLDLSGRTWRRLNLNLQGHREAHRLRLDIEDPRQPALHLQAAGGLDEALLWKGQLQTLVLDLHEGGQWHLAAAQALTLGAARQYLGDACLVVTVQSPLQKSPLPLGEARVRVRRQGGTERLHLVHGQDRLCYGLRRDKTLQAHLDLPRLDLALLQPWLPEGLDLKGVLTGRARIHQTPGSLPQGELQLGLQDTRLQVRVERLEQDLDLSGARLGARADAQGLKADLHLPLDRPGDKPLGEVQGEVRLAGLTDPGAALRGRLDAHIDDIAFLAALAPQVTDLQGRVRIAAKVSGTRAQPKPEIDATLEGGAVKLPMTGLELKEIRLSARNQGLDRLRYEGAMTSGGRLTLKGETRLDPGAGWPTRLHIEGEDFVAANLPEAHVEISPALDLALEKDQTRVEGTLKIPFARLRPRALPETAVSGSPDLVVAEDPQALADGEKKATAHRVEARIRLQLGKRVSFEGFGLRARFGGDLLILERPHRPTTANGRLTIEEGTYRAYGQDLTITQGMLFYADTPVDNPGVQLRAERKVGEVTAGLEVRGTLKRPRLTLYSTPTLPQNEILSYLVLGHAPGEGGDADLGSAAAGAVAGKLAAEAGRQLGLDQLRVDNAANLDQAALVAGTYLSPDLYVEYVQHVNSRSVNLKIRYDINERLQLESETGDTQGVDLYYTIEH